MKNALCLINHLILLRKLFKELLFLALLIFIPTASFAQLSEHTFESSIQDDQIYAILQIQIRDSNNFLVGYIETHATTLIHLDKLSGFLDNMSTNPDATKTIYIDDKKYQVIITAGDIEYTFDTLISMSLITDKGQIIIVANHDGIPVRAGDSVHFTWTMIRPA
jgi:hypothetical protein